MRPGSARDREGGDPSAIENARHVLGVSYRDAESESSHRSNICDFVVDLLEHDACACVVACVDVRESVLVVCPSAPLQVAQVDTIGNAEVVEWAEQVSAQRIPE